MRLARKLVRYVSINGNTIRKNAVLGTAEKPIRIAKSPSDQKPEYAREIAIYDVWGNEAARLIYDPEKKIMRCGARLVLKCPHGVKVTR